MQETVEKLKIKKKKKQKSIRIVNKLSAANEIKADLKRMENAWKMSVILFCNFKGNYDFKEFLYCFRKEASERARKRELVKPEF